MLTQYPNSPDHAGDEETDQHRSVVVTENYGPLSELAHVKERATPKNATER
ncbi:hypothetical protein SNOG_15592 [Parastagonospora nodorum SN15]|uniref:Uncharacterized protein n=1 Tax=Phaeosphaeria nodorum (strain SN15 / ATCC MYA-4574 / FGSC 10173) TaxID=321614 RepID=Q0TXW4_PHANO|nr:hypothetical protein SNOG_15592 [Parastagonospora nodorum SN15]EAT76967.1 hypothetical protein SNOG_15592 [Parastagonospora nodorum SN15]